MKVCTKCGNPGTFHGDSRATDGLKSQCKECQNESRRRRRADRLLAKTDPKLHDYEHGLIPEGYEIKGVTVRTSDGTYIKSQKAKEEKQDANAAMLVALAEMMEPFKGSVDPVPAPEDVAKDLLLVLPIGDAHVGLRCHSDEVGEEFDLRIQEENHMAAVDGLVAASPEVAEGLIVNVGDYLHSDNRKGTTTKGTPLDTDGSRFSVLLIALRMFRRTIDAALLKCGHVTVICATGNHDGESSVWLRLCLALAYEREQRVTIRTEPTRFHYYQFGRCGFGVTHGDTCKVGDLPIIFATDAPSIWASTEHRAWLTGHVHHTQKKEMHGCTVNTYRTLAAQDEWHKGAGYRSGRDLHMELWHREHGQIQEFIHGIRRRAA